MMLQSEIIRNCLKQHHNSTVTPSPKPPLDLMGKIKLQLHTFLPMMS